MNLTGLEGLISVGDLLILENNALKAAGASNLVGLRMAEVLKGVQVVVVHRRAEKGVPHERTRGIQLNHEPIAAP